jgi:hypothetical protein
MANCIHCTARFTPYNPQQKYCSRKCSKARYRENNSWQKSSYNLPTGTVGAIAELKVAADLLQRGYEVFRSVSQSCSCDLAIIKSGKLTRVEVKTGYENPDTGTRSYPKNHRADILAVSFPSGIVYMPELVE